MTEREEECNRKISFAFFVCPSSSCLLFTSHIFKLCCCTHPHLVCSPREPALSSSTFLSIFCEFKFTSSELVSNQNQPDTRTILSLFAVNSYTPPCSEPPEATRSPPSGAGERLVQATLIKVPKSHPQRRPRDAEPRETQLDPLAFTCGWELT